MKKKSPLERAIDSGTIPDCREKLDTVVPEVAELVQSHGEMILLFAVLSKRLVHDWEPRSK